MSITTSQDDIKKNQAIYIYYGDRSNAKLFLFNGFVINNHPKDYITITLSLNTLIKDPLYKLKKLLLSKLNFNHIATSFIFPSLTINDMYKMLQYCRIATLNKDEITLCLKNVSLLTLTDQVITEENEKLALQFFINTLYSMLNQYPTTYEDDVKHLNQIDNKQLELCTRLIITEKKLLTEAIYVYEDRLKQITI